MSSTAWQTHPIDPAGVDLASLTRPAQAVGPYMVGFLDQRPLPDHLREAVRYALLGSGKRLRPALVILTCQAVGGAGQEAMAPAAAIEMIHCFSLVHDDLPALDNDDLRRGRPTLHKHTDEATAILAGDALMGLAFELIATRVEPETLAGRMTLELSIATNNMIAGQVYDTFPQHGDLPREPIQRLETIHRHKTGALIRCCARMGAMCGQADRQQLDAVTRYAQAIGLMFQAVDDLLDVTQTTQQLGKATQKDTQMGKLTYPGLLGIEQTQSQIQQLQREAHQALEPLGRHAERLHRLCDCLAVRQK